MNDTFLAIFINAITGKNIALYSLLGLCPLIFYKIDIKRSLLIGVLITIIMFFSNWLILLIFYIILLPLNLIYLQILFSVLLTYLTIHCTRLLAKKFSPSLVVLFDTYPEFFYTNYAIYGIAFLNLNRMSEYWNSTVFALGSGIGYTIVILILMAIKERLHSVKKMPLSKRTIGELVILGLMSLVFISMTGLR